MSVTDPLAEKAFPNPNGTGISMTQNRFRTELCPLTFIYARFSLKKKEFICYMLFVILKAVWRSYSSKTSKFVKRMGKILLRADPASSKKHSIVLNLLAFLLYWIILPKSPSVTFQWRQTEGAVITYSVIFMFFCSSVLFWCLWFARVTHSKGMYVKILIALSLVSYILAIVGNSFLPHLVINFADHSWQRFIYCACTWYHKTNGSHEFIPWVHKLYCWMSCEQNYKHAFTE